MGKVVFYNEGILSLDSIKSFGVSVKEGDNPIGYFGTGLKYALAIYLRERCEITIISGGVSFEVGTKEILVRGVPFNFITINGETLSFTTELGKNWHPWQAFRELYCNALDEGGGVSMLDPYELNYSDNSTYIVVEGEVAERNYHERDSIVLKKGKLIPHGNMEEVDIIDEPSNYLFYRGIRVLKLPKPSCLTYNVNLFQQLTEDRGLQNAHQSIRLVERTFTSIKNKPLLKKIMTSRDVFEDEFDYMHLYHWPEVYSEEFIESLEELFESNNDAANKGALSLFAKIKDKRSLKNYEVVTPTDVQAQQLTRAVNILSKVPAFSDILTFDILIVKTLGMETMALADREKNSIVLSLKCFTQGTKYLVSTIIEEYIHLTTGLNDCTRALQTHLFDVITTLIEENIIKEPI